MQGAVAEVLATITPPGRFAVELLVPGDALSIQITGVGRLDLPLSPGTVARLRNVAKPSRFGLRDRTIYDTTIRDSREIARRRIRIDQRHWNRTLTPALADIRAGLGLAEGIELKAELDKMLIYGRGQFFLRHQDSEKGRDMIGTLVVSIPSKFRGGELTVEQHGEVMAFRGSHSALQLVAFYADCRHQVHRVTSGARVVLTYNLFAKGIEWAEPPRIEPADVDALAGAMQRHFETPVSPGLAREPATPDRLVYLLDYEYTAQGLRWELLKGADAVRAAALRAAAKRLDCEIMLAQADVHETWECESADWGDYDRRPYRDRFERASWDDLEDLDDEDDGDDLDELDLTPSDLIDSVIELRSGSGGRKPAALSPAVRDEELCFTRPSRDLSPFETEYTGYMGNWGNTMDRWYHRGAVVIWPRRRRSAIGVPASASVPDKRRR